MTFLIIYEEVPEHTYLYLVETDDPVRIDAIRACHGKFVNLNATPEVEATILYMEEVGTVLYDSTAQEEPPPTVLGKVQVIVTGIAL